MLYQNSTIFSAFSLRYSCNARPVPFCFNLVHLAERFLKLHLICRICGAHMTSSKLKKQVSNHLCYCHQKTIQIYFATALMEVLNGQKKCGCTLYNLKITLLYLLKDSTLKYRYLTIPIST